MDLSEFMKSSIRFNKIELNKWTFCDPYIDNPADAYVNDMSLTSGEIVVGHINMGMIRDDALTVNLLYNSIVEVTHSDVNVGCNRYSSIKHHSFKSLKDKLSETDNMKSVVLRKYVVNAAKESENTELNLLSECMTVPDIQKGVVLIIYLTGQ